MALFCGLATYNPYSATFLLRKAVGEHMACSEPSFYTSGSTIFTSLKNA